jgi:hypothetical protein
MPDVSFNGGHILHHQPEALFAYPRYRRRVELVAEQVLGLHLQPLTLYGPEYLDPFRTVKAVRLRRGMAIAASHVVRRRVLLN